MFRPKNETEVTLLLKNKSFGTLIKQTFSKPQETLEIKLT